MHGPAVAGGTFACRSPVGQAASHVLVRIPGQAKSGRPGHLSCACKDSRASRPHARSAPGCLCAFGKLPGKSPVPRPDAFVLLETFRASRPSRHALKASARCTHEVGLYVKKSCSSGHRVPVSFFSATPTLESIQGDPIHRKIWGSRLLKEQ